VILIVKSPFAFPALLAALTMPALLSACGQTGPLYMPKPPARAGAPAPAAPAAPAAGAPVNTVSPPAPAAGTSVPTAGVPAAGSTSTNTQIPQQPSPATQQ
jgi:predicted small lipoprotein YifL